MRSSWIGERGFLHCGFCSDDRHGRVDVPLSYGIKVSQYHVWPFGEEGVPDEYPIKAVFDGAESSRRGTSGHSNPALFLQNPRFWLKNADLEATFDSARLR